MPDFKPGNKVTFTAVVHATVTKALDSAYDRPEMKVDSITTGPEHGQHVIFWSNDLEDRLYMTARATDLEPVPPEDWPPRIGDVWAVGDEEWFARLSVDLGPFLVPAATGHDTYHGRSLPSHTKDFEAFKALNPVLKYRRP
jgi:hypothetical protein